MAVINMKDAEAARNSITEANMKDVHTIYGNAAKDIQKKINKINPNNSSASYQKSMLNNLKKQIKEAQANVGEQLGGKIKDSILDVSNVVAKGATDWARKVGVNVEIGYTHVSEGVVEKIASGQIYDTGWSLSQRIWSDNQQTQKAVSQIVAQGVATNSSAKDIAKNLQAFVNPDVAGKVKTGVGKNIIDYNAMRLARTLPQHGYQQAMVEVTKNNPWVNNYIWIANGGHSCPLCAERNGQKFTANNLPLDHPNGMCTVAVDVDINKCTDDLANWFNADWGEYPDIDKFATDLCGNDIKKALQVKIDSAPMKLSEKIPQYVLDKLNPGAKVVKETKEYFVTDDNKWIKKQAVEESKYPKYVMDKLQSGDTIVRETKEYYVTEKGKWIKKQLVTSTEAEKKAVKQLVAKPVVEKKVINLNAISTRSDIPKETWNDILETLNTCDDDFIECFSRISNDLTYVGNFDLDRGAGYYPWNNKINIDIKATTKQAVDYGFDSKYSTLFHETGHAMDTMLENDFKTKRLSNQPQFMNAMKKDLKELSNLSDREPQLLRAIMADDNSRGLQDAVSGSKHMNAIYRVNGRPKWGHSDEYWRSSKNPAEKTAVELYANISGSKIGAAQTEYMNRYFPNAVKVFNSHMKKYSVQAVAKVV